MLWLSVCLPWRVVYAMSLLPDPRCLTLETIRSDHNGIIIVARTTAATAVCPDCAQESSRVHSYYHRSLADLPWQATRVCCKLTARKFRCQNADCPRKVFAERLPSVAQKHAQKTIRLAQALQHFTWLTGGAVAARIARLLGIATSPDSLLDCLKRPTPATPISPRVLGVDDFAFRRGHVYGTILVDLERRCPIDLLPDRESKTLEGWLRAHPGIEILSRDRSTAYTDAANKAIPSAIQVADRWHLFKNISDALEKLLLRKHRLLREITLHERPEPQPAMPPLPSRRADNEKTQRKERRLACYERIVSLHEQGVNILGIQRLAGVDRKTIRKYLNSGALPERQPRPERAGKLTPFHSHLKRRWLEGRHNGAELLAEIRAMGYSGGYSILKAFLRSLRARAPSSTTRRRVFPPSPRRLSWLATNRDHPRARSEDIAFLDTAASACPEVQRAMELAQRLCAMIRERRADGLASWLVAAQASGISEMKSLAAGLRSDFAAVEAALSLSWSNGPVEGQVNRLKFIKRLMYGRAGFDLLRARVLYRATA